MSKFLKIIVNLFLVCAILVAAAILVPPIVGVKTTIVDSQLMETNLPMGSVTYSKDTYVTELTAGDRILAEDDSAVFEYTVEQTDMSTGSFTVHDTRNPGEESQTIQILNSAPKVVFTVPFIGYVVYAMHSIEGIIILALAVLLMIILFILSELWKHDEEDDEEEEDEHEEMSIPETEALDLQKAVDITPYMSEDTVEISDERTVPTEDYTETSEDVGIPGNISSTKNASEILPEEQLSFSEEELLAEAPEEMWVDATADIPDIPEDAAGGFVPAGEEVPAETEMQPEDSSQEERMQPEDEAAPEEAAPEETAASEEAEHTLAEETADALDLERLENGLEAALIGAAAGTGKKEEAPPADEEASLDSPEEESSMSYAESIAESVAAEAAAGERAEASEDNTAEDGAEAYEVQEAETEENLIPDIFREEEEGSFILEETVSEQEILPDMEEAAAEFLPEMDEAKAEILPDMEEAAEELLPETKEAAAEMIAEAEETAAEILPDAEEAAAETITEAEEAATEILPDAEEAAAETITEAEEAAAEILPETEEAAAEILPDAEEAVPETEAPAPEVEKHEATVQELLEEVDPSEWTDPAAERFIAVERPKLEEILKSLTKEGKEAEVRKDPVTGLSVVDMSELL